MLVGDIVKPLATFLMAVAFAGVGFKVNFRSFLHLGLKAFQGGVVVTALTSILALLLVIYLHMPASSAGID